MKQLALTFCLMWITVSTASATDDSASLFACGLNFGGGSQLTFSGASAGKTSTNYGKNATTSRLDRVAGRRLSTPVAYAPPKPVSMFKPEQRLPPKMTFATLGCSWR
ncbi:hypothetical protein OAN12_06535 [Halioglobus sp.]|nr:hypothetical protein [Halioglobus sp.]